MWAWNGIFRMAAAWWRLTTWVLPGSFCTVSCLFTSRSFPLWATYQMSPLSSFASRGELIIFFCFGRNASSVLNCCYTKYCQFHFLVFEVAPGLHSGRATLTGSKKYNTITFYCTLWSLKSPLSLKSAPALCNANFSKPGSYHVIVLFFLSS